MDRSKLNMAGKFLLLLLTIFISGTYMTARAQELKEVVQKISEAYNTTYRMNVQYKYTSYEGKAQTSSGEYIKGKNFSYLNAFGSETIEGDTFLLLIDHNEKILTYTRREKKDGTDRNLADSLLNLFVKNGNIIHKQEEKTGVLKIRLGYGQMNEIILVYNKPDFTLKEFRVISKIESEDGLILSETLSMIFLEQKRGISPDSSKYSIGKYVKFNSNGLTPVAVYSDYQIYSLF